MIGSDSVPENKWSVNVLHFRVVVGFLNAHKNTTRREHQTDCTALKNSLYLRITVLQTAVPVGQTAVWTNAPYISVKSIRKTRFRNAHNFFYLLRRCTFTATNGGCQFDERISGLIQWLVGSKRCSCFKQIYRNFMLMLGYKTTETLTNVAFYRWMRLDVWSTAVPRACVSLVLL